MKKLFLLLAISLLVLGSNAQARNSADTYDNKYYSQQEFVDAYNNTTTTLYRDFVVGLDVNGVPSASPGINPNNNLGQYVTEATTSTTDNVYVFGVIDSSSIPPGQLGKICIRGPHKVVVNGTKMAAQTASIGTILSQCASTVSAQYSNGFVTNGGGACYYSTATGTAAGMLGMIMNATATTDTGDVGQTTNAQSNTTWSEYWSWINPQVLR